VRSEQEDMGGETIYLKALAVIPMWPMRTSLYITHFFFMHFGTICPSLAPRGVASERERENKIPPLAKVADQAACSISV